MATFNCKLDKRKNRARADDKYPLCVVISDNRDVLYLPLGIDLSEREYAAIFGRKSYNKDYAKLVAECQKRVEKAKSIYQEVGLKPYVDFRSRFFAKEGENVKTCYVSEVLEAYINEKKNSVAQKTISIYRYGVRVLERFSPDLKVNDVDERFLIEFEKWFKEQKPGVVGTTRNRNSQASASNVLRTLKSLVKYAMNNSLVTEHYKYPFMNFAIKAHRPPKQTLLPDEIKKVIDAQIEDKEARFARDVWVALYRMNGINFIDLLQFKWDQINQDFLSFTRTKTKRTKRINVKEIQVHINEKVKESFERIGDRNSPFILGLLEEGYSECNLNNRCMRAKKRFNSHLRRLGEELKLSVPLTLSEARNAYANTLKKAGISFSVIAEQLGHSSVETSERWYLSSFDKDTIRKANDCVF